MKKSLKDMMFDSYLAGMTYNDKSSDRFGTWYKDYIAKQKFSDRKFTDDQVRQLRADCANMTLADACIKHGINYNTGWAIRNMKTYKDVT